MLLMMLMIEGIYGGGLPYLFLLLVGFYVGNLTWWKNPSIRKFKPLYDGIWVRERLGFL